MVASASMVEPVGLRIFPLWGISAGPDGPVCQCPRGAQCKDVGKHPMVRWREYDSDERGPSGGYGIPTGVRNGIFVVDLDVRPAKGGEPAKNGVAALVALAAGRPLPDTAHVRTPSGGVHLYFRLPAGVYVPNKRALIPGVDVRGEGGYVVGPGSPHKNGGTYQEAPGEPTDAPPWLLDLVVKPFRDTSEASEHRTVEPLSPEGVRAIAWAKDLLATAEPAIDGRGGSDRLFAVTCKLMYSALPLDTLQELVEEVYNPRCEPPWSQAEIEHKLSDADDCFEEPRGLPSPDFLLKLQGRTTETSARTPNPEHEYTFSIGMRGSGETTKASFGEIAADLFDHVAWAGVLSFNVFRNRVVAIDPPMKMTAESPSGLDDNDVQLVRAWLEYHGKKIQTVDVRAAIEAVARQRPFHPVQDYLKSRGWDGVYRLDHVLPDYFNTPAGPYELGVGPRWFISLVARAMTPGCQSDCTLILEGPQGIGKTSALRSLVPDPLWYRETTSGVDSKDFLENLRGVWLMAFDELDSLSKGSLTKVKTTLTTLCDGYRKSYGHYADDYPRSVGFCGSTNTEQYFNDPTGGRRFWPAVVLRQIDVAKIIGDRDQLWAEAFHRWHVGEPWHVNTPELLKLCEEEQEARLVPDAWEEPIQEWLNDPAKVSWKPVAKAEGSSPFRGGLQVFDASEGITTSAVLEKCIGRLKGQWTSGDLQQVGRVLRKLGLKHVRRRLGASTIGKTEWRYVLPAKSK